jgi:hypothetical protein
MMRALRTRSVLLPGTEGRPLKQAGERGIPRRAWRPCLHPSLGGLVLVIGAMVLTGCAQRVAANASSLLDQAGRTLERRLYVQELNNIARFLAEPEVMPQYIRLQRGTIESRPEPKWSIGTDTYLSGSTRTAIVWEFSVVTDPGDLERMRLLFQWATRHVDFDELQARWDEIRDQPELGADGKPLLGSGGRPALGAAPLPIARDSSRDWYTTSQSEAAGELGNGEYGSVKVWIKDFRGASMFALAVQRAMPNSKRRRRRRLKGEGTLPGVSVGKGRMRRSGLFRPAGRGRCPG